MTKKEKEKIKLWVFIFVISIIVVGVSIYFTYKQLAYEKSKVETYIIYNTEYAYFYNNKIWQKITDTSFIEDKNYDVYNNGVFLDKLSATVNYYTGKVTYSSGTQEYSNLIGINSNRTVPFKEYNQETLSTDDVNYIKAYLSNKGKAYVEDQTIVKMFKLDIDVDLIPEKIFEIYYKQDYDCYNYILIKDGSNTETILSYTALESEMDFKKSTMGLIIDADLDEKKEILIIEYSYEYSKLLLYANQYGTYSLIE